MDIIRGSGRWASAALLAGMVLLWVASMIDSKAELKIGSSMNLFNNFGVFYATMRVIHGSDSRRMFEEHTSNLFQVTPPPRRPSSPDLANKPKQILADYKKYLISNDQSRISKGQAGCQKISLRAQGHVPEFEGDFRMEFCDDARQLLPAYFRDFTIERVARPWYAFTARWDKIRCVKNLGFDDLTIFDYAYSFILVKLSRHRSTSQMTALQNAVVRLNKSVESEMIPGNIPSLQNFFGDFGTHYISSYTTGDSLYQVFAYRRSLYTRIKGRMTAEFVSSISSAELVNYFGQWYVDRYGKILAASGNRYVEDWAARQLKLRFYIFRFPSLVHMYDDPALLQTLNSLLGNEAVLQLDLRSLSPTFADEQRRHWFDEVFDNQLLLWETNMCPECYNEINEREGYPT